MLEILKLIWIPIERVLKLVGRVQSAILLTVFYVVVLGPVAIIFQLVKLFHPQKRVSSYWKPRPEIPEIEETLLRQF